MAAVYHIILTTCTISLQAMMMTADSNMEAAVTTCVCSAAVFTGRNALQLTCHAHKPHVNKQVTPGGPHSISVKIDCSQQTS